MMDSLDREIADAFTEKPLPQGPGRILIVGAGESRRRSLAAALKKRGHRCDVADGLVRAQACAGGDRYDLVLAHATLPDGDGLDLIRWLRQRCSTTRVIVLSHAESFREAVEALRCGVTDLLDARMAAKDVADRVETALRASRTDAEREKRLAQLKMVCKKLVDAREEVSGHLDRLCQDLVAAYDDVSSQMSEVAMATEFRTLLRQELDVEDLLRTALEYLLTRTGPTNAAVFLPDACQTFELGAYVNYDCPRETIAVLLNHLCRAVCPQMADETEIVAFEDADTFAEWVGADAGFLGGCEVVAFCCMHEGKCMAVMVLFRKRDEPFDESLVPTIDILRAIFAEQISQVVRIHHRAAPSWPKDPLDEEHDVSDYDDFGFGGMVG